MSKKSKKNKSKSTNALKTINKTCGECSVCCTSLLIDTPELAKKAGVDCKNLSPDRGCAIYIDRPSVCRSWKCGWLQVASIPQRLRPDKSKVLIKILPEPGIAMQFSPINKQSVSNLVSDDILYMMRSLILANKIVTISVPTKDNYCSFNQTINEHVSDVMDTKESFRARIADIIRYASIQKTDLRPEIIHVEAI